MATNDQSKSTIVDDEIKKFSDRYMDWWTKAIPLLNLNKLRVPFARDGILSTKQVSDEVRNGPQPLKDIKLADIGCAAGLFSEELAKIGADVTGIDACKELIDGARAHAALTPSLAPNLRYLYTTVEDHVKENSEKYDAIVCSEVIEHVDNQRFFIEQCVKLVKPNGSLVFTTINRNWFSGFNAIIWAEYIMRLIPRGTHHYKMFISSDDLAKTLEENGCEVRTLKGFNLKLNKEWKWKSSPRFWYALHAIKKEAQK